MLLLLGLAACYETPRAEGPLPPAFEAPLTADRVRWMLEAGVSDEVLQAKAERTGILKLSAEDLVALKEAGGGDELLAELIRNERENPVVPESVPYVVEHSYYYYYHGWPSWWYAPYAYPAYRHHHGGVFYHRGGGRYRSSGGGVRFSW